MLSAPPLPSAPPSPDPRRRLLLDLGASLLGGGLPVNDVEEELRALGHALDAPDTRVAALPTGLFVGLSADDATAFQPVGGALRFEQTTAILDTMHRLRTGALDGARAVDRTVDRTVDGAVAGAVAELNRIRRSPARWPAWVADFGSLPVGVGLCLYLQPGLHNVIAAAVGSLIVSLLTVLARHWPPLRPLLPIVAGFTVSVLVLLLAKASFLDGSLRTIVATLAILLPGSLLVTGLSEVATGATSAGAARLTGGTVQLALFIAGIAAAATATDSPASALANVKVATAGWWGPTLGLALALAGVMVNVHTPLSATPWIIGVVAVTCAVQIAVNGSSGAAIGGLAGAVTAAVAAGIAQRLPRGPLWQVTYLPAFWVLAPGSFGLLNTTTQIEAGGAGHSALIAVSAVFGVAVGTMIGSAVNRIPLAGLLARVQR